MVERRSEFFDILLRGTGPSPELLGAFALGLLVVSILGNLAYDLLIGPQTIVAVTWRPVIVSLLLTGLAYLLYRRDLRRKRRVRVVVEESRLAPPHAGVVWLLGPGPVDHMLFALEHHRRGGGAAHCWLVMQSNEKPVQDAFEQLSRVVSERGLGTQLHPVYIQALEAREAYQAVEIVFNREAAEAGLKPGQVIADITGGTKPLTAGMVLGALTTGRALEYVESERDDQGRPIPGTLRVVLVDTTFYLTQDE